MPKYNYSNLPENVWETLARNAGMLVESFTPEGRIVGAQLGATNGGVNVYCTPVFKDNGDDVDNCPKESKELKEILRYDCGLSGTFISAGKDTIKRLLPAFTESGNKFVPSVDLQLENFKELWYILDYGKGGYIAVKLIDALSTAGLNFQTVSEGKTRFTFTFTGHSSVSAPEVVPMEFYVEETAAA